MAEKAYNAGTIFLQVVPVFRDFMEKTQNEARKTGRALGDEMEKGGKDAGRRAGDGFGEEFTKSTDRHMGVFEKKVRSSAKRAADGIDGDVSPALARIKRQFEDIGNPDITPKLDHRRVMNDMRGLTRELRKMATNERAEIDVRMNARQVYAEMVPLMKAFSSIDGKKLHVSVDLDAGAAAAKAGILRSIFLPAKGNADEAANSFRSFNAIILAVVTLLPALVPVLAAVGGGLAALIPILGAVGAGLGIMLAGFSGIGPVIKGLSDVQKNAGQDALVMGKRIRSAARGVEDAERSLANARQSAAQANADAARQVARAQEQAARATKAAKEQQINAERDYAKAQRDSKKAVDDLRAARKQAQEDLKQAADNRASNALDVRQGVVDVFNATVRNSAVQNDGSSTNLDKEQAAIELARAQLSLKEARDEQKKLSEEKKKTDKAGVNGTDAVIQAQDNLTAAIQRQRDAQKAVADAAAAYHQAQVDGSRAVADAVRNQQRTQASGTQSIADAQRNLTQAQEDYTTAVSETSTSIRNLNDALSKVGPAGERFARFIFGLREQAYALRNAIQEAMLPGVQAGLEAIIKTYGPQFKSFATRMAGVMGGLFKSAGKGLGNEPWREFFDTYSKIAPKLLQEFGQTTGNWMGVYARFFTIAAPFAERLSLAMLDLSRNALGFMQSAKGTKFWNDFLTYASQVGPAVAQFFWNLVRALVAIGIALAPLGAVILNALDGFLKWVDGLDPKTLGSIATAIIGIIVAFQAAVGLTALFAAGTAAFTTVAGIFAFSAIALGVAIFIAYQRSETFRNLVAGLVGFLKDHKSEVETFAKAVGALGLAWVAYQGYLKTLIVVEKIHWASMLLQEAAMSKVNKARRAMVAIAKSELVMNALITGSIWAQNAAWLANPITWVVLAIIALIGIFVLLYKHNEHVRKAINALWSAMKTGASIVWNWLKPILAAIGNAFVWLWEKAIRPSLVAILNFWKAVFNAMAWTWKNILWPILDLFIHIIKLLWNKVIKPYLGFILNLWKTVFHAMAWAWNNILSPVLQLMGDAVRKLWNKVTKPIFGWIGRRWHDMTTGIKYVWDKFLKPVFDAFSDKVLPHLKTAFQKAIDFIKTAWTGLKKILAAPILFVLDQVINKGLIAGFNWVAKKVGSTPMSEIPVPKFLSNAVKGKARGGTIRSASDYNVYPGYTPGRDVGFIGISGGEGILRPEATRALGHDWIARTNAAAISGGVEGVKKRLGYMGGFARGGVVWPVPGHSTGTYPGHNGVDINRAGANDYGDPIVAFRDGKITYVGWGRGYGQAIMEKGSGYPEVVYGHTSKVYVHSGQSVKAGQLIGRVGSTGNSTGPHLHFGLTSGGTTANALALLQGATGMFGMGLGAGEPAHVPSWVGKILDGPVSWLKDRVKGKIDGLLGKFGDNPLTQAVVGVGEKLFGGVGSKIKDMAQSFKDGLQSAASHVFGMSPLGSIINAIKGSGNVKDDVRSVAKAYGWDKGAEWNALDWVISHESGWNPNADNPTSSAAGLFQKMTSIHGPLEKTVVGQAKWGLNYIADRYGDPIGAERFWKSHGYYAKGGVVPDSPTGAGVADNGTMMYDNGGFLPPGLTTVLNLTGKPEPVFTADQFDRMGSGGGSGVHYEPHFHKSDLTAKDVAFDLDVEFRKLERVGKRYGGGGE